MGRSGPGAVPGHPHLVGTSGTALFNYTLMLHAEQLAATDAANQYLQRIADQGPEIVLLNKLQLLQGFISGQGLPIPGIRSMDDLDMDYLRGELEHCEFLLRMHLEVTEDLRMQDS